MGLPYFVLKVYVKVSFVSGRLFNDLFVKVLVFWRISCIVHAKFKTGSVLTVSPYLYPSSKSLVQLLLDFSSFPSEKF